MEINDTTMITFQSKINDYFEGVNKIYLPHIGITTVIFSFYKNKLNVLLLQFSDTEYYSLPGGYVKKNETLEDASFRVLQERSGLQSTYLEQFYTAGNVDSDNDNIFEKTIERMGGKIDTEN